MVSTYFFPKLTKEELQLLEVEDENNSEIVNFTQTFACGFSWGSDFGDPIWGKDVLSWSAIINGENLTTSNMSDMSEPKSKFVAAFGRRQTYTIDNPFTYHKDFGKSFLYAFIAACRSLYFHCQKLYVINFDCYAVKAFYCVPKCKTACCAMQI